MRILVISGLPWNKNNNLGSTFSSIFAGMDDIEFLNIYCGYGLPDTDLKVESFQMTEISLLKNLINPKKNKPLIHVTDSQEKRELVTVEQKKVDKVRKYNNRIVFWGRCFIWKIGRWKTRELHDRVVSFDPDIIMSLLYYNPYLNNLTIHCHKITKAPVVIYSTDDVYSLHQYSLSPFYWVERLIVRKSIESIVRCSKLRYTITNEQKTEYQMYFGKEFKLLTKGDNFDEEIEIKRVNKPILIVYTGAVYGGRFSSLKLLMEAMDEFNNGQDKTSLKIYSYSVLKNREERIVNQYPFVHWMGGLPASEMKRVQNEADILLHVESLRLSESLEVRHSFSTKLVDYFKSGRAILAIGRKKCASCAYITRNNCGYVAESKDELVRFLDDAYEVPKKLEQYATNALRVGRNNHQIDVIQAMLKRDLEKTIQEFRV